MGERLPGAASETEATRSAPPLSSPQQLRVPPGHRRGQDARRGHRIGTLNNVPSCCSFAGREREGGGAEQERGAA
jgi:hypothetical protein